MFRLVNSGPRTYSASQYLLDASEMAGTPLHAIGHLAAASAEHTRRRIAFRLLPFVFVLYTISYLGRTSVAHAAIGMARETLDSTNACLAWDRHFLSQLGGPSKSYKQLHGCDALRSRVVLLSSLPPS